MAWLTQGYGKVMNKRSGISNLVSALADNKYLLHPMLRNHYQNLFDALKK